MSYIEVGVLRLAYSCGCQRSIPLDRAASETCPKHPRGRRVSHLIERPAPRKVAATGR